VNTIKLGLPQRAHAIVRAAMVIPILTVSACGGYTPNYDLLSRGPSPEFSVTTLEAAAKNQQAVIYHLSVMAGLGGVEPVGPGQWKLFGIAALGRARLECNAYITEIMKVEEQRRTTNQQLALTGAATAGILGLAGAASIAIAITAIAFGLVQGTVDNVSAGLLYSLGAEPVQALIANLRGAYTDKLTDASWQDRPTTFNTIYGYLELCTPAVLREKIKSAVANVQPGATDVDRMGGPPRVTFLSSPTAPLPVPPQPQRVPGTRTTEIVIPPEFLAYQQALCVPPAAAGNVDALRAAFREFLQARGGAPAAASDHLSAGAGASQLRAAVAEANAQTCAARGYQTAFEVGLFGNLQGAELADKVSFIQGKMNAKLDPGSRIDVDGKMDTLRTGIGRLRRQFNPNDTATSLDFAFLSKIS